MDKKQRNILNVPNMLTVFRLLLVPVFCCLMCRGMDMPALGVFLLAGLTDLADGYLARRYNQITDFGKLVDPIADKTMVLSLMVIFAIRGMAPVAALVILAVKELVLMLGGLYALRVKRVVVFSKAAGKAAQLVTVIGLALCFFHRRFAPPALPWHLIVLWLGVGLSLLALAVYAKAFFDLPGREPPAR